MIIFVTAWSIVGFYVYACIPCWNGEHLSTGYFAVKIALFVKGLC